MLISSLHRPFEACCPSLSSFLFGHLSASADVRDDDVVVPFDNIAKMYIEDHLQKSVEKSNGNEWHLMAYAPAGR